jgi:hypothetical protein
MTTTQEIKNLCISSRAFCLNGNTLKSNAKKLDAQNLIYIEGYNAAHNNCNPSIPNELKIFDFLFKDWNEGLLEGFGDIEVSQCQHCQNKEVSMCHIHDF